MISEDGQKGQRRERRDLLVGVSVWTAARLDEHETLGRGGIEERRVQRKRPGLRLGAPVEVRVETRAVTLQLPIEHAGACADRSCRIGLEAELIPDWLPVPSGADGEEYRHFELIAEERSLQAGVPWTVRLAVGFRYRAVVTGAGGRWMTPVVEPGVEPVTLVLRADTARLQAP